MWITILIAAAAAAVTGLLLGLLIAFVSRKFEVAMDPRVDEIISLLPGANCGGCGYAGCADFAKAVAEGRAEPGLCAASSPERVAAIAHLMGGVDTGAAERKVAVVLCSGSSSRAERPVEYNGILDCRAASLIAGAGGKACRFGCIGFASCVRACPFGAIEMVDNLAVVHSDLCRGCGKCESVCPRKLIHLVPAKASVHIFCNSLDIPQTKRRNCKSGCLTCRKCVKSAPEQFLAQTRLIRVNYSDPPSAETAAAAGCPVHCLETAEEHLRRIKADAAAKHQEVNK